MCQYDELFLLQSPVHWDNSEWKFLCSRPETCPTPTLLSTLTARTHKWGTNVLTTTTHFRDWVWYSNSHVGDENLFLQIVMWASLSFTPKTIRKQRRVEKLFIKDHFLKWPVGPSPKLDGSGHLITAGLSKHWISTNHYHQTTAASHWCWSFSWARITNKMREDWLISWRDQEIWTVFCVMYQQQYQLQTVVRANIVRWCIEISSTTGWLLSIITWSTKLSSRVVLVYDRWLEHLNICIVKWNNPEKGYNSWWAIQLMHSFHITR